MKQTKRWPVLGECC